MASPGLKVHFIAIGGAVMHNLAMALDQKGIQVSGSDDEIYEPAKSRLAHCGLLPEELGWYSEKITEGLDAVILGMHAQEDNPELKKAREIGIKVYSFPEFVFEQSKNKQRIVIAGSHGKTSITSMILHVLKYYNRKFDYLVGAQIEGFDLMVRLTEDSPLIVIEGDEYLSSAIERKSKFLFYHPHITLLSGIAWDHFNVFPTFDSYVNTFEELADGMDKAGVLVYDETDDIVRLIGEKERTDVVSVPYKAHPYEVRSGQVYLKTKKWGETPLEVFGEHNMKNLQGAKMILERVGINEKQFYEAIRTFKGASKRLESLGSTAHTAVYRDFAHSPSKLGATTAATKELFIDRRLIAVYELHTFSSLNKSFLPHYEGKLADADLGIVFYSPHTLERKRMPAITEQEIRIFFGRSDLEVFTKREDVENYLLSQNWYNTNLLLMSSGTFDGMDFMGFGAKVLELSEEHNSSSELDTFEGAKASKGLLGKIRSRFKK